MSVGKETKKYDGNGESDAEERKEGSVIREER